MEYSAVIRIDDDRWCKHPYSIKIYDEDGDEVTGANFLNSREACYRISDKYGINHSDIEEEFY